MDDETRDDLVAAIVGAPHDRTTILDSAGLTAPERDTVAALVEAADLLWLTAHGAPPLADDPVAAMLGLIAEPTCSLDPNALSRARKRARLTVSELASRLRERGWYYDTRDIFRWETPMRTVVSPAVIEDVSAILKAPVENLIKPAPEVASSDGVTEARRNPLFTELVNRWARARHVSQAVARAALESRMSTTVHRGEQPDSSQILGSLDALVTAVEQGARK